MTDYNLNFTPKRRGKRYQYTGTRYPEHRGEWFTVSEWCALTGSSLSTTRRIVKAYDEITDKPPPCAPVGTRVPRTPGPKPKRYRYVGERYPQHQGKRFSCREWGQIIGAPAATVQYRVRVDGGVIKDTRLTVDDYDEERQWPKLYIYQGDEYPEHKGEEFTVSAFAALTGLTERAVRHRIKTTGGECIPDMRVYTRRSEV